MFFISYGTRTEPMRDPQGRRTTPLRARKGIDSLQELTKIPHRRRIWPYGVCTGPLRSPHGLFTGCLGYQNPYGARKLIMHAWKLYGPRTVRQNSYGARAGPVSERTIFVQNSPGTARTGPGSVMWLGHNFSDGWYPFQSHYCQGQTNGIAKSAL